MSKSSKKNPKSNPFRPLAPYPGPASGWLPPLPQTDWEVTIAGDLTDQQGDLIHTLIELPRRSSGLIYLDSCGGSAYVGLALASLIKLRGLKASAIVTGECSSAALMPFAACEERYVTPHSSLLFHPIRWQSEEQVKLEEAVEWARHFRLMEADHDQLLARMFGCSLELIVEWSRPGRFLSGAEIIAANLAHKLDLFEGGDLWEQIEHHRTQKARKKPIDHQTELAWA
ncbi:MAG: hypothetical protein C0478_10605 [Planctomyces sp.]|nr:hypothetical protein [Planctomyces sp.]